MAADFTQAPQNGSVPDAQVPYDPFQMTPLTSVLPTTQYNPYLEDTTNIASNGAAYYQPQTTYTAPAQPVSFSHVDPETWLIFPASISSLRANRPP